jgi:hypothetical protein
MTGTTDTNVFADGLSEAARTSHDETVSTVLRVIAGVVKELGVSALQGPAGPQGVQGVPGTIQLSSPSTAPVESSQVK